MGITATTVGSTTAELKGRDADAPRKFPCGACGADLTFSIGLQKLHCDHCGHEKPIAVPDGEVEEQDYKTMLDRLMRDEDLSTNVEVGDSEVTCETCGATVVFSGGLTAKHCSYCGGPISRDHVHQAKNRIPAHGVLPFRIEKGRAQKALVDWVSGRWFAPNAFKKRGIEGDFSGVYIPYWTYDSLTSNTYRGERGEHYYVTVGSGDDKRRERRTRWYPAQGQFQTFFDDVLIAALNRLDKKLLESLEPWPFDDLIRFTPDIMPGFLAQTYDIALPDGFIEARRKIDRAIAAEVRSRIGGDTQRVHNIDTRYDAITFKHLLLPVWLMAYRYKNKAYQLCVNATTGRVRGTRPYSIWKIALFVTVIAATIFGIWFALEGSGALR